MVPQRKIDLKQYICFFVIFRISGDPKTWKTTIFSQEIQYFIKADLLGYFRQATSTKYNFSLV
jgi:hypothetical protein